MPIQTQLYNAPGYMGTYRGIPIDINEKVIHKVTGKRCKLISIIQEIYAPDLFTLEDLQGNQILAEFKDIIIMKGESYDTVYDR